METAGQPGLDSGALEAALTAPAFNAWLGVRLVSLEDGVLRLEMPWRDELASNPRLGYAHGGVLASVIDIATFYVVAARNGAGGPTVDLRVDYHRPAMPGPLHVEARIIRMGRTLASAEARVTTPDDVLLASGRAVLLVANATATGKEAVS